MAVGVNSGNQLNVFVFEIVYVLPAVTDEADPTVTSIGVHPLLVAPTTIQYSRTTRSTVQRNIDGSLHVKAGRNLDTVTFQGTFGTEFRGIGKFGGSGEVRRRLFEKQVIGLGDAINRADIDDALNIFGTELGADLISELTTALAEQLPNSAIFSGDPTDAGYFAINLYDFYNRRFFQCQVVSYTTTRAHRNGGASGLVPYNMTVREVGPVVAGAGATSKLLGLLEATATAADIVSAISDVTIEGAVEALALLAAIPVNMSALEPLANGLSKALRLIGPSGKVERQRTGGSLATETRVNLGTLFSDITDAVSEIRDAINSVTASSPSSYQPVQGHLRFETAAAPEYEPSQLAWQTCYDLNQVIDALEFGGIMGCFFGLSRTQYQALVSAGNTDVGPLSVRYTVDHAVQQTDNGQTISAEYGVPWADILSLNGLAPDEALYPGTVIKIPLQRALGNVGVDGLEVFDSHAGASVYGRDIDVRFKVQSGDLAMVTGLDCLRQGLDMLVEGNAHELYKDSDGVPDIVRYDLIGERLRRVLRRDARVLSVTSVDTFSDDATLQTRITANVRAIGGQSLGVTT